MLQKLAELVKDQMDYVTELRHKLHQVPEPAFSETKTAGIIADELDRLGLRVQANIASTGIVADIATGRFAGYVALRADMDALPIKESTGVDYSSRHPGYSHCYGHDGHSAALVGTALVLDMENMVRSGTA